MPVRVAVGDPRPITVTFPGTATGNVDVLVESARTGAAIGTFVATSEGDGRYTYTLTSTDVEAVDELTLTFTGTFATVERTISEYVQVAGRHYFTVEEARSIGPIDNSYSDAAIEKARMDVEDQIEANCNTSFVARFVAQTINSRMEPSIRLTEPYILDLISVFEDGVDITSEVILDGRYLGRSSSHTNWTFGRRNVEVKYEAGYDPYPPGDLRRKSIEATRYILHRETRTGVPTQAVTIGTEVGTLRLAVAGLRQPFGLPEVDAVVLYWAKRVGAAS